MVEQGNDEVAAEAAPEAAAEATAEATAEAAVDTAAPAEPVKAPEPAAAASVQADERPPRPKRVHVAMEAKATIAVDVTRRSLELMGVQVASIEAKVDGEQVGLKVGPVQGSPGEALDGRAWESLQFLLNKAINRHAIKRTRLNLEAEGFRARRSEGLDRVVGSVARMIQQTGRAIAIGPIEGADLRLLATQFNRTSGVSVQTVGEQDKRLLVVAPGGGRRRRR